MNKSTLTTALLMLAIGVGIGYWMPSDDSEQSQLAQPEKVPLFYRNPMNPTITSPLPAKDDMGMDYIPVYAESNKQPEKKQVLFYRNPMNPTITSPVPAKDEMGMDYVPVFADRETSQVTGTVKIDPVIVQNMGVRTAIAKKETLSRTIRALGVVSFNEERMTMVHPKVEGWIEEIMVDKTGELVKDDAILLSIYSPKLVSTQQEYLLALNNVATLKNSPFKEIRQGAEELVKSSRERLQFLDVPEHQIKALEKTKKVRKSLHIHSPGLGTVIKIGARQGQFVTPSSELYMLVDLDQVWVYADVYDYELQWLNQGDGVAMALASVPGKTFTGTIAYIYPYASPKTRTTKVRMVFENKERLLRPDMLAEVRIKADVHDDSIVVPAEAIIRSGAAAQVLVVRKPGQFEPKKVELGIESGGKVSILSGVKEGDEVVVSAQFLVDSESKLREATAKMLSTMTPQQQKKLPDDHAADTGQVSKTDAPLLEEGHRHD